MAVALLILAVQSAAQTGGTGADAIREDWLRIVPGEARLYVEIEDLVGIRRQFRRIGIWETIRELSESRFPPAGGGLVGAGEGVSKPPAAGEQRLLGLAPEAAVTRILGRRCALFAARPADWRGGVLLAELSGLSELRPLLKDLGAVPTSSVESIQCHALPGGARLAVFGRMLIFGPAEDPAGLWGRTVRNVAGQIDRGRPGLGARSEFSGLRARLGQDFRNLLYASWEADDPFAVGGCRRLLAGFASSHRGIRCELRGALAEPAADYPPVDRDLVNGLPADSLAVWSASVDWDALARTAQSARGGAGASLLVEFVRTLSGLGGAGAESRPDAGPRCTLVAAADRQQAAAETQPARAARFSIPALLLMVDMNAASAHLEALDRLMGLLAHLFAARAAGGDAVGPAVRKERIHGIEVHSIELGLPLARRLELPGLERLQPAWARMEGRLLIGTSREQLLEVISASLGLTPSLGGRGASPIFSGADAEQAEIECLYLRGTALARMIDRWLLALRRHDPRAMTADWWSDWAEGRAARRDVLGLGLADAGDEPGVAVVRVIETGSPARGLLWPEDRIVAAQDQPLDLDRPAWSAADAYRRRGAATEFRLKVIREGRELTVTIPVPARPTLDVAGFNPALALRHLSILLRPVDTLIFRRRAVTADRFDADVEMVWSLKSPVPAPAPASRPSSEDPRAR